MNLVWDERITPKFRSHLFNKVRKEKEVMPRERTQLNNARERDLGTFRKD